MKASVSGVQGGRCRPALRFVGHPVQGLRGGSGLGLGLLHTDGEALSSGPCVLGFWWTSLEHHCFGLRVIALCGPHLGPFLLSTPCRRPLQPELAGCVLENSMVCVFSLIIRFWEETHWLEFPAKRIGRDSLGMTLGRWHCPGNWGAQGGHGQAAAWPAAHCGAGLRCPPSVPALHLDELAGGRG